MFPIVMKSFKFKRSLESSDTVFWEEVVNDEKDSLISNKTWKLVNLLSACKTIGYKQVCGKELKSNSTVDKFKTRLDLDFFDHFFPVTNLKALIRSYMA